MKPPRQVFYPKPNYLHPKKCDKALLFSKHCMLVKNAIATVLFFFCLLQAAAQQGNPPKSKWWAGSDSMQLDSLTVLYGSVQIAGFENGKDYRVDYTNGTITWLNTQKPDSLLVFYRTLAVNLNQTYRLKNPALENTPYLEGRLGYTPTKTKPVFADDNNLLTAGNLSRGIGFGNNQDVTVNSNLNLRINGIIANDVKVIAAISDENNPIQPEGNTQQLQDFDKVFISLSKDSSTLTVGDFIMQNATGTYFNKFYKKSRGLQLGSVQKLGKGMLSVKAEAAVARGRFSRNVFNGIEGNRGPYRLKGTNGEQFIIIIAGTESVYLDGTLLQRGEQNDYVIDYNSGELTFMPRVLITRFSRIVAEFQYSDRNYARSVLHSDVSFSKNKNSYYISAYREADNKNQPFQQSLDGYDSLNNISARQVLANAGDVAFATIPRIKTYKSLVAGKVLYVKKTDPVYGTVYEHATENFADTVYYELAFSYLGSGKGNYTPVQSGANGRVYAFVAPVAGVPQGDYEPVDLLVPARSMNMLNAGARLAAGKKAVLLAEAVMSRQDQNTFSSLGDANNNGFGGRLVYNREQAADSIRQWNWKQKASLEWVDDNFRFIERYRDVEFDRRWNRTLQNPDGDNQRVFGREVIGDVQLAGNYRNKLRLNYNAGFYDMKDMRQGLMQQGGFIADAGKWKASLNAGNTLLNGKNQNNNFYQYDARLSRKIKAFEPGLYARAENSRFTNTGIADSLVAGTYAYQLQGLFLNYQPVKGNVQFQADAARRDDNQPENGSLMFFSRANTATFNTTWQNSLQRVALTATYRNLQFAADSLKTENTLQSRLDAGLNLFNKGINLQSFWQVGTGQEQRREFSYLQVQPGNGFYIWNDYDSNGLQSLNEFEPASDLDRQRASYIRVFTPVQGFIQSINTQFNQNIRIEPSRWCKKGTKAFAGRFSGVVGWSNEQKQTGLLSLQALNPFTAIAVDQLLFTSNSLRATLFFNRSSPVAGFDYSYFQTLNKNLLVNGFEWRTKKEHQLRLRWNINRSITFLGDARTGEKGYTSAFFPTRSYQYLFSQAEPRLQYQHRNTWRLSVYYRTFTASNLPQYGTENMHLGEYGTEFRLMQSDRGTVNFTLAGVNIHYNAPVNTTLAYDLLQGLQPGNNTRWNISAERRLAGRIQLSLNYDGRKSPQAPVIHLGRVVARYLF